MKVQLKKFQDKGVRSCVKEINAAFDRDAEDGDSTAILLHAPTGSGKTVISTAVLESILDGSAEGPERPNLRVLWLTDSPSLNKQSAEKMDRHSDFLRYGKNLIVIDESYDEPVLAPGTVHFAHIQQLTSSASSWQPNEAKNRKTALWHAIAKTVRDHGDDLLLVIDEAHKAIGKESLEKQRPTIIKTVLEGGINLYDGAAQPKTPVALVMTATPENFLKSMMSSDRVHREVKINVRDVQESGLLKKQLRLETVQEKQKATHTLLDAGTDDLFTSQTLWKEACDASGDPLVTPVMVVQVENNISAAELGERVKTITDKWAKLTGTAFPENAFGHSYTPPSDIKTAAGVVRHIEPNEIDGDSFVRVVFFKEALTTGWDCPRAEVMVSLRTVADPTTISQLVGRMVRTPMAKKPDDPRLDCVDLYLPFYDTKVVKDVVSQIALDTEGALDIELAVHPCTRNPEVTADAWAEIDGLPKYRRPSQDFKNELQRAAALAEMLMDRAVVAVKEEDPTPEDDLRGMILAELARIDGANMKSVDKRVKDLLQLDTQRRALTYAGVKGEETEATSATRDVHFRDIDAYFSDICRRLPEGSGSWYFEQLVANGMPTKRAKMRVAAVAELPDVITALNVVALKQIEELRKLYEDRVESRGLAVQFKSIWYPPTRPVEDTLMLTVPPKVAAQKASRKGTEVIITNLPLLAKHVFAFTSPDGKYVYPGSANSWEAAALDLELSTDTVVAWFRNPNSGAAALSVPYWVGGEPGEGKLELLHPDFVFVHEIDGELYADIIDPHLDHGDSRDKWRGLAKYAAEHADRIRRAVAVTRIGQTDWGLNLSKPDVRAALDDPSKSMESIFEKYGNKRIKG